MCSDSAAVSRDFLVGLALESLLELVFARAGEDQVRMAIHEARQNDLAGSVDDAGFGREWWQVGAGTEPGDAAVADDE